MNLIQITFGYTHIHALYDQVFDGIEIYTYVGNDCFCCTNPLAQNSVNSDKEIDVITTMRHHYSADFRVQAIALERLLHLQNRDVAIRDKVWEYPTSGDNLFLAGAQNTH